MARLKAKGVFSDTSFARDIVRMSVNDFVEFLDEIVDPDVKKEFTRRLKKEKHLTDKSFKGVALSVLEKLGGKVLGEVGKDLAGDLYGALSPVFRKLSKFLSGLLSGKGEEAAEAAAEIVAESSDAQSS